MNAQQETTTQETTPIVLMQKKVIDAVMEITGVVGATPRTRDDVEREAKRNACQLFRRTLTLEHIVYDDRAITAEIVPFTWNIDEDGNWSVFVNARCEMIIL